MTTSAPGLGRRREAREEALAALYEVAVSSDDVASVLDARVIQLDPYAIEMALGVDADRDNIEALISRNLKSWRIERMALVDRVIASMATWELIVRTEIPTGVILSEVVELATQYSGEESPRFLNGVMRAVANEVRGE